MRIRQGLTYANLTATVALFIALGGGAYAVSKDSVGSKEIETGAVRSKELKDDDVRSADIEVGAVQGSEVADGSIGAADIADGSLAGADIADGSLGGGELTDGTVSGLDVADGSLDGADVAAGGIRGSDVADDSLDADDIEEGDFYFGNLPLAGGLSAQARSIGGDGTTLFGPISGRAAADASADEVASALPPSFLGNLTVFLPADLSAGQIREFTVVLQATVGGPVSETDITCTILPGQSRCFDFGPQEGFGAGIFSLRIENTGGGLTASDSAYIGLSAKSSLENVPLGP